MAQFRPVSDLNLVDKSARKGADMKGNVPVSKIDPAD